MRPTTRTMDLAAITIGEKTIINSPRLSRSRETGKCRRRGLRSVPEIEQSGQVIYVELTHYSSFISPLPLSSPPRLVPRPRRLILDIPGHRGFSRSRGRAELVSGRCGGRAIHPVPGIPQVGVQVVVARSAIAIPEANPMGQTGLGRVPIREEGRGGSERRG